VEPFALDENRTLEIEALLTNKPHLQHIHQLALIYAENKATWKMDRNSIKQIKATLL